MEQNISRIGYAVRLSKYIKGMWKYLGISILFNFLFKITPVLISLLTAYMINSVILGNTEYVWQIFTTVCCLVIMSAVFAYLNVLVSHDLAYRILAKLRNVAYDKIDELAPAAMEGQHSAGLTSIVLEDVEQLEWFYAHVIGQIVVAILIPALSLVFLGILSPIIPLALIPFIVAMLIVPIFSSKKANNQGVAVKKAYAVLNEQIVDGTQGIKDIISFGWQNSFFTKFNKALLQHRDSQMNYALRSGDESRKIQLIIGVGTLCGEITAAILTVNGYLEAAWLIPVFQLCSAIFVPLQDALTMSTNYGLIFGAAKRIFDLLEMKPVVKQAENAVQIPVDFSASERRVKVAFEQVGFCYPSKEEKETKEVLKNVTFAFTTNETVALVGASGSGKTTISRLLQRFWDVNRGSIKINGMDIKAADIESLREIVTVVPQDVYLFNLSVADNLRIARSEASMDEIVEAAKMAQADGFIRKLPNGYDTMLGERGVRLSGGEKQRISIAQAFLKNSPILVLDEITANLDSETERQINMAVERLKKGRATMVIAHRVSTIRSADRIIVLNHGEIIANDTYDNLMEHCEYFRQLIGGIEYAEG